MTQVMTYNHSFLASAAFRHHDEIIPTCDTKITYTLSTPDMPSYAENEVPLTNKSKVTKPQHVPSTSTKQEQASTIINTDIQDSDVLCGRDKISHSHVGNKRFLAIIKMNREAYQNAPSREDKTRLSSRIVTMIRKSNGRFLKCNETTGEWEPQDDIVAREKVAHALRSCKDPSKRPKTKKPRRAVKKYEPTQRENELFEAAWASQQRIFKELMEQHDDDDENDDEDENDSASQQSSHPSSSSSSSSSQLSSSSEEELDTPIDIYPDEIDFDMECLNILKDL